MKLAVLAVMVACVWGHVDKHTIRQTHIKFDANKDGLVTRREMHDGIRADYDWQISPEIDDHISLTVNKMFAHDSSSIGLSQQEFMTIFSQEEEL